MLSFFETLKESSKLIVFTHLLLIFLETIDFENSLKLKRL
jgi:hypothetical protein